MPVDMSRIPAQTQQALAAQRGATNAQDMTAVLEMLAQDPQSLSQALAALGIQVSPDQLQTVAEDWVDQAAEGASGEAGEPSEGQASSQAAEGGEEAGDTSQQQGATPPSAPRAGASPIRRRDATPLLAPPAPPPASWSRRSYPVAPTQAPIPASAGWRR